MFDTPRTVVFYGIKVGLQKGKGAIEWDDDAQVVKLIEKHFPEQADVLIKTTKKPVKKALAQLTVAELKKLGIVVEETGDQVVIKSTDSEIDKLVNALLKEDEIKEGGRVKTIKKQRYNRWVTIRLNISRYCHIALSKGMRVLWWGKPDMCAWYGMVLSGTPQQMKKTEEAWTKAGGQWYKRMPRGAWDVPDKPEEIKTCGNVDCPYKCSYKEAKPAPAGKE